MTDNFQWDFDPTHHGGLNPVYIGETLAITDLRGKDGKLYLSGIDDIPDQYGDIEPKSVFYAVDLPPNLPTESAKLFSALQNEKTLAALLEGQKPLATAPHETNHIEKLGEIANASIKAPEAALAAPKDHGSTTLHINKNTGAAQSATAFKR